MYRSKPEQPEFEDFIIPFNGALDETNRWIKMSKIIPWEELEGKYADKFSSNGMGAPAKSFRIALGALLIKEKLNTTDEETVEQIRENAYLQYFLGLESFESRPLFDSSMMVHFRKRLNDGILQDVNHHLFMEKQKEERKKTETKKEVEKDENQVNKGKLIVDATCTPADIHYPTDLGLLNKAREKTEEIIDILHAPEIGKQKKARTYRRKARKEYLRIAKKRKVSKKAIRKAVKKQLSYVKRNLKHIENMVKTENLSILSKRQYRDLLVIQELYRQQKEMFDLNNHSIPGRIVSISQPHIRPIVRGKAGSPVEFGAKVSISVIDGYVFVDHLSWESFNESGDLITQIALYKERTGHYPESVHADKIYRTRANLDYCNSKDIRLSGPLLGRPSKDKELERAKKKQIRQDEIDRIPVEGKFGQSKRRYSLNRVMTKTQETSEATINLVFLVMNLEKLLKEFIFVLFVRQGIDVLGSFFEFHLQLIGARKSAHCYRQQVAGDFRNSEAV